jgi:protein TonB
VRDAKLISSARAIYPSAAKQTGIQGSVTVAANVDATGKVIGARALTGPMLLREAAVDSVKQWKYSPAVVDGKPAPSLVTVSVEFKLN